MNRRSILKLMLIFALAAVIYLADMYVLICPTERVCIQGDGTGHSYQENAISE